MLNIVTICRWRTIIPKVESQFRSGCRRNKPPVCQKTAACQVKVKGKIGLLALGFLLWGRIPPHPGPKAAACRLTLGAARDQENKAKKTHSRYLL
ncbi:hypothetical protein H6F73_10920 [Microcoleus sp. FACHB-68]|nr:hypothetical protein [Microcoleus sp. FACHB-68]